MLDATQAPVDMGSPNGKYEQFLVFVTLTSKKAICSYLNAALD